MTIEELHKDLTEAYTVNNLNTISLTLISLFKNQQFSVLQRISEMIDDFVNITIADDGKGFHQFMMLYHPDRVTYHLQEINRLKEQNNFNELLQYSHILKLERIGDIATAISSCEDIDYNPVYEWDLEAEGFSIIVDDQPRATDTMSTELVGYSFYDALLLREYGDLENEYPLIYLENTEEFELSSSDINDLDGIQFCIHAKMMDLSDNRISDLLPLTGLKEMEELNLSYNQIAFIDDLSSLKRLKSVFLSNNFIEDISPLFELQNLEYADLSGNKIRIEQINRLTRLGVTVDY